MQNAEFRTLLKSPPSTQDGATRPSKLGSRARPPAMHMAPRNVKALYSTQIEQDQNGQPARKKFKSSSAPKGSKFALGYVDRAQERQRAQNEEEDKGEEQVPKVKGLDFEALQRARRGENDSENAQTEITEDVPAVDVDEELEQALEQEVVPAKRTKTDQVEEEQPQLRNQILSRDEILARLKQNRKNPSLGPVDSTVGVETPVAQEPALDASKFRRLQSGPKAGKHKFTETIDGRRREVLVITKEDGSSKRKVRWLDPEPVVEEDRKKPAVSEIWGGDLPEEVLARQKAAEQQEKGEIEDDDADIFGGVGDYDPLAGIDSDDSEAESMTKPDKAQVSSDVKKQTNEKQSANGQSKNTFQPRNYFNTPSSATDNTDSIRDPSRDSQILAALKRAAQLRRHEAADDEPSEPRNGDSVDRDGGDKNKALLARLTKQSGNDDVDMDLEFGGSRFDDDEDGDAKIKLSQWKGTADEYGDEEEEEGQEGGGKKKKRTGGGKKRKGDKNSFKDVMDVMERRKG